MYEDEELLEKRREEEAKEEVEGVTAIGLDDSRADVQRDMAPIERVSDPTSDMVVGRDSVVCG